MTEVPAGWMEKGDEDLKVVEHELKLGEKECASGAVCFHAQQAAEKYLKAYLIDKKKQTGRTHDIALLLKLCAEFDTVFKEIDAAELNFYAVQVRYPDNLIDPTFAQAEKSRNIAVGIINLVKSKMK